MIRVASLFGVLLVAGYFIAIAVLSFFRPGQARRFLLGFAASARTHYMELALRSLAGAALLAYAPRMRMPDMFSWFGWALLITSLALFLLPWRWHQRFAARAVPVVVDRIRWIGAASLLMGTLTFGAVLGGAVA